MMQPLSPRAEQEVVLLRRTSSTVSSPQSGGASSSLGSLEVDSVSYASQCPPVRLRSHQVARIRSRIKSLFAFICGLVTIVLFMNLFVGTEMSVYLSKSHSQWKNATDVIQDHAADTYSVVTSTRSPSSSPTIQPTPKPPDEPIDSKTHNSTTSQKSTAGYDNPWFDDESSDSSQADDKHLAPMVANASSIFTERWCDLEGTKWMPSDWQRRAPYFLIPGAKYSGTLELAQELATHPSIVPGRSLEPGFFFQHNFQRYISSNHDKTKVLAARSRMFARDYPLVSAFKEHKSKLISFDATPGYLFYSSTLPRRILCVMPWVRLVIVLRNPVDRVWEHYQKAKSRGLALSLDEWIDKEMVLMNHTGLLSASSKEENYAWYDYQRTTLEGAIGRSLYDIQLRQWFQALRAVGRDPSKSVYVVRAEDIAADPQREYSGILKFLQVPDALLKAPAAWDRFRNEQAEREAIDATTRKRLDSFFAPYSKRLKTVLRRYKVKTGGKVKNT